MLRRSGVILKSIDPQNSKIIQLLSESIEQGSIVHAYVFTGGSKDARADIGRWFAQTLLYTSKNAPCGECLSCRKYEHGNHEDFISISRGKDRETISVEQISGLIDQLSLKPFGKMHVVLIADAELMNPAAQNKLLKTLEEPVSETVIILLADREESLLPTVLSRCVRFCVNSDASDVPEEIRETAKDFAAAFLSGAPYYKKKNIILPVISDKETSRDRALLFLDALEEELCSELKSQTVRRESTHTDSIPEMIRQTEAGRRYLRQLHSVQWTLKQLCLR